MFTVPMEIFEEPIDAFVRKILPDDCAKLANDFTRTIQGILDPNITSYSRMAEHLLMPRDQSTCNRFITARDWDPRKIDEGRLSYILGLKQMKSTANGIGIIDDTLTEKTGKSLESASYHFSHTKHRTVFGQNITYLLYSDDSKEFPIGSRPYVQEKKLDELGRPELFKTRNELAGELIDTARKAGVEFKLIAFDSWFTNDAIISKCIKANYHWLGRLKISRVIGVPGKKRKKWINVRDYANEIDRDGFESLPKPHRRAIRENEKQLVHENVVLLRKIGPVKIVIIKKKIEEDPVCILVTDDLDLSASEIIKIYSARWNIEVFNRDIKQNFGLSNCSHRLLESFKHFLCLHDLAYTFIQYYRNIGHFGRNGLKELKTCGDRVRAWRQLRFESFARWCMGKAREGLDEYDVVNILRDPAQENLLTNP